MKKDIPSADAATRATENDEQIHTIDTGVGVVLETKIDVLINTETE